MKFLIVSSNFWPEPTGISIYATEIANSLLAQGNEVQVLTGLPHYPWWKVPSKYAHFVEGVQVYNGLTIIRAGHFVPTKMNALLRIHFELSLWWNLRRVASKWICDEFDAVIAFMPTVAAGIVGEAIAMRLKIPFGLIVQDFSGAGAKQSGLRGGRAISKVAEIVENMVLHSAKRIVVVSSEMLKSILNIGIPAENVCFIPNYSAKEILQHDKHMARQKFGWDPFDFIVIHTGNIGAKQGLENVIETTKFLKTNTKIKIILVGHGNREKEIQEKAAGLSNIQILSLVSEEDYPLLLSAADLLLINERPTQMDMSLPSKLTSYLFSNRPVLAAVPHGGATWKYLDGFAELVEAGHPQKLADRIHLLSQNPIRRDELAKLGFEFARKNLDAEKGRARYLQWVKELIEN
jgi:colanic acid biosynthesis glycosyl transferase WcaI